MPEEIFSKSRSLAGVLELFLLKAIMKCLKELDLKILNIYIQIYLSKVAYKVEEFILYEEEIAKIYIKFL